MADADAWAALGPAERVAYVARVAAADAPAAPPAAASAHERPVGDAVVVDVMGGEGEEDDHPLAEATPDDAAPDWFGGGMDGAAPDPPPPPPAAAPAPVPVVVRVAPSPPRAKPASSPRPLPLRRPVLTAPPPQLLPPPPRPVWTATPPTLTGMSVHWLPPVAPPPFIWAAPWQPPALTTTHAPPPLFYAQPPAAPALPPAPSPRGDAGPPTL
jgi:hypothetical protein